MIHSDISVHTSLRTMLHRGAHFVLTHLITGCVTVHTVLAVHALFSAAAVGIWTVHSQDCSQPLTLTSRCTHHVHTMLHRGAHFVLTHLITG